MVLNVTTGTAPFSWDYTPTGTLVATDTGVVGSSVSIDTDLEFNGATGTYVVTVTDANGCTGTMTVPYTRCSCVCDGTTCKTMVYKNYPSGGPVVHSLGVVKGVKEILLHTNFAANNFRIKRNGAIVLDTKLLGTTYSSGCVGVEPFVNLSLFAVGDDISATANGIIAKGGTVNSTYITSTVKASASYAADIFINEPTGALYEIYVDESGTLGACDTSSFAITVICPA